MSTREPSNDPNAVDADTRAQIRERLQWSPAQRLAYLKDMIAFERRAANARRVK